jgi:hypothetical protein
MGYKIVFLVETLLCILVFGININLKCGSIGTTNCKKWIKTNGLKKHKKGIKLYKQHIIKDKK